MIILDTNVVSELMKPNPSGIVLDWIRGQEQGTLAVSAITLAEIAYGLERLPQGKRRKDLQGRFERLIDQGFDDRVLEFGAKPALLYGELCNIRLSQGLHVDAFDMMIAAIAQVHDCAMAEGRSSTIATRNTGDFQGCSLQLINPFEEQGLQDDNSNSNQLS